MLAEYFNAEVDVQVGNGRLNYINGYVSKDHDAVDVALGEYIQKGVTSNWLSTYRLLCKTSPGIPECAIRDGDVAFARGFLLWGVRSSFFDLGAFPIMSLSCVV